MKAIVAALLVVLWVDPANAIPPRAGAFLPPVVYDLGIAGDYVLIPMHVSAYFDGPELAAYNSEHGLLSVDRWHPERHGFDGAVDGPGLCLETWTDLAEGQPMLPPADLTGDGIDDWVMVQNGQAVLYQGKGLNACR